MKLTLPVVDPLSQSQEMRLLQNEVEACLEMFYVLL